MNKITLSLLIGIMFVIAPTAANAAVSGTVAEYLFDESGGAALDTSGNGNTGILENGAVRYVGVQQGNKIDFGDGDRQRVRVSTANSVNNLNSFSVSAWVRPTEYGGTIVRKSNADTARFNFGISSEGALYLRAGHTSGSGVWRTVRTLPLNTWTHVTVTYSFSSTENDPTFYIGGTMVESSEFQGPVGTPLADTAHMYIGNNHDLENRATSGFDSGFEGRMDKVRVYNRALSSEEARNVYEEKHLVAEWKFDEASGTTAIDSSGNQNHGTLENGLGRYSGTGEGNKLDFDGGNERMRVNTQSANILDMNSFTVMAWIRPTENAGIIMRKGNTPDGRFSFGVRHDGSLYLRTGYTGTQGAWKTNTIVPLNTWSHVAVAYTYGTQNTPTFYVNGVRQETNMLEAPFGSVQSDTPFIYLGNNHDYVNRARSGFSSGFEGRMDIVRVYDKEISLQEVYSAHQTHAATHAAANNSAASNSSTGATSNNNSSDTDTLLQQIAEEENGTTNTSTGTSAGNGNTGEGTSGQSSQGHTTQSGSNTSVDLPPPSLSLGARGSGVSALQRFLMQIGDYTYGEITGYYGPATQAAVMRFQCREMSICSGTGNTTGYGVYGPRTRDAMIRAGAGETQSSQSTQTSQQQTSGAEELTRNLRLGNSGSDVRIMQQLLVREGVYPEAIISGYFGRLTEAAVIRFQEKYRDEVLTPAGLTQGNGFVGPLTRAKMNELLRR